MNSVCVGVGEIFPNTLFKDWSFGVIVREMPMAVNYIF